MAEFDIANKYLLEVHWKGVEFINTTNLKVSGCVLSGPATSEISSINKEDYIRLDFSNQYVVLVKDYYISNLSWNGYSKTGNNFNLHNVILKTMYPGKIQSIAASDYIMIDTSDHEDDKHNYNLNYKSYLIKQGGELYNFGGN